MSTDLETRTCTSPWFVGLTCDHLFADCPNRVRDTEADAVEAARLLDPTGKRVVAWLDSESQGPWVAADAPESHEKGSRSAEEAGSDRSSYTGVVSGPESGDFGEVA